MAMDTRKKDHNWTVIDGTGSIVSVHHANLAVLMDIRDQLKILNSVLHCQNFLAITRKLDRISRNTAKPRKRKES